MVARPKAKHLPNRLLRAAEILCRKDAVHNRNFADRKFVSFRKRATRQQRNSERREKVGTHTVLVRLHVFAFARLVTCDGDIRSGPITAQNSDGRISHVGDSRITTNRRSNLFHHRRRLIQWRSNAAHIRVELDQMVRLQSQVDIAQIVERSRQKASTHQQHKTQRDLHRRERQSQTPASLGALRRALMQHARQIRPRREKHRRQTTQQSCQQQQRHTKEQ